MKNVLCYFGIIILLGLALLPPILRIVLPLKEKEEKKEIISNMILSCSNNSFIVNTSYIDEKTNMIIMKKLLTGDSEGNNNESNQSFDNLNDELLDSDTKSDKSADIIKLFDDIKNKNDVIYRALDDGEVLSIDFSVSDHKELKIDNLVQDVEKQKLFYEQNDLKCVIK